MATPWTVSVERTDYQYAGGLYIASQLDTWDTTDGQASEDSALSCGMASIKTGVYYLTHVTKTVDTIHDEEWGQGYIGPSDWPQIVYEMQNRNGVPCSVYHPATPQAASAIIYAYLKQGLMGMYLRTGGSGAGHWCTWTQMDGGTTSNPFDTTKRGDPWGGIELGETWAEWTQAIRRYVDKNYLLVGFDRQKSIILTKPTI